MESAKRNDIILRPYQDSLVSEARSALGKYHRILLQLATGGGKTIVFSYIAAKSQLKGSRVLILSSRTEILMQNGGALARMGLEVEYVNPKRRSLPSGSVVAAMSQTLKRRVEKPEWVEWLRSFNLVIIDECHEQTSDFVHDYLSPRCYVMGVTATPRRYGKMKQLGLMYDAMVTGVTIRELIDMGYLSPSRHYAVTAPKLNIPVDVRTGDYNQKALARQFESRVLYKGVVDEWMRLCRGMKTICFCVSSKQAIEVTKEFVGRGISARYVLSGDFEGDAEYSGERKEVMESFKRSEFTVLVNVGIAVAGLDVPDIECVIANFATVSLTKWKQAIGRGARVSPGKKEFVILDCGGNYSKLGMYEDEPRWCLWHDEGSKGGLQELKVCNPDKKDIHGRTGCGREVPVSCKVCPACGYEFVTEKQEYQMHLEEVVRGIDDRANLSVEEYVAQKKLAGWNTNRILVQICLKNIPDEKRAFYRAAKVLNLNPKYWYSFEKHIWSEVKRKQKKEIAGI